MSKTLWRKLFGFRVGDVVEFKKAITIKLPLPFRNDFVKYTVKRGIITKVRQNGELEVQIFLDECPLVLVVKDNQITFIRSARLEKK